MRLPFPLPSRRRFRSRYSRAIPLAALTMGLAGAVLSSLSVARAQDETPAAPQSVPQSALLRFLLPEVNYDAAERGPLLVIASRGFFATSGDVPEGRASLTGIANATNTRLVAAGGVNALVARTMTVLNASPGKANPFSGMEAGELLKLLLASFTPGQWAQVGSTGGIGRANLTQEQTLLWDGAFPARLRIQENIVKSADGKTVEYDEPNFTDIRNRDAIRLRVSKKVTFSFSKVGAEDYSWGGDPYFFNYTVGSKRFYAMAVTENPDGSETYHAGFSAASQAVPNSAYGVQLVSEGPRRLKSGAMDFAAPALNARVSLAGLPIPAQGDKKPLPPNAHPFVRAQAELDQLPTVGALLERISQATGIEIIADRRVRNLPLYLRGESARAGDLLMALAWSVAGTYRSIEPGGAGADGKPDNAPLYLLTEDVPGIGARVANLSQWAQDADEIKRKMMDGAKERSAKNDPLAHLSFAPGDKYALSEAQAKAAEDGWRREKYASAPEIKWKDLSPALQDGIQKFVDAREEGGVHLRTDRVRVGEELQAEILIPQLNAAIRMDDLSQGIGHQYIEEIAYDATAAQNKPKETPEGKPAPVPALGFAAPVLKGQRRVLVARPAEAAEAVTLARAAAARGMTDLWLEVSLQDADASARLLAAAVKAAGGKIAVGGAVRLLKGGGVVGEPERNILGETGEAFKARLSARYSDPAYHGAFDSYTGWVVPERADLTRRLKRLAAVPGLSGLTIRASGAPGWTGLKRGGDGIWPNAALGYTPTVRRAFLREKGIDPIDIPEDTWVLSGINWNLGYFAASDGQGNYTTANNSTTYRTDDGVPRGAWWAYRKRLNDALLTDLFRAIKKDAPNLALYLDNRISGFYHANTDWFGSWDAAERLPDSGVFSVESEIRADARRSSKTIFAHWGWWWNEDGARKPDAPAAFARQVTDAALRNPPPAWDGIVLDLTGVPGGALVPLLGGLPEIPSGRR